MNRNILLKQKLDRLYDDYLSSFRSSPEEFLRRRRDPILFPHRYAGFHDREAAAMLAATFAYGNVTSLCAFIHRLLFLLGPSPHDFLKQGPRAVDALAAHEPYYRLQKTPEILALLKALAAVYSRHDSLYALFLPAYDDHSTMKGAIAAFVARLRSFAPPECGGGLKFLVPSPEDGSTCKRLNLFLRWMVRRDGIDLGLWTGVSPSRLIMPVDTHIGRVAYRFGWIDTPSLTWQKAERITEVLRGFDPEDPVRYDFSLCHESMEESHRRAAKRTGHP